MNDLKKIIKVLSVILLLVASISFSNIIKAEGEEYPLDPDVTFSIKAVDINGNDITNGSATAYHGNKVYIKVIDNKGNELDNNLFTFETNEHLVTYSFIKGDYFAFGEGTATITAKLNNDPLNREATASFKTIKGPIKNVRICSQSDQEIWYVVEVIGNDQLRLDYNKVLNDPNMEFDSTTGNAIQYLKFMCGYSDNPELDPMIGYYPTKDELEFVSSNPDAVKAYYKDWFGNGEEHPTIEICGNGTATITVTYKNELRPKASITFVVENYSNDAVTNKNETSDTSKSTDNKDASTEKSDTTVTENDKTEVADKIDVTDNKLEVSEIKNKMSVLCFIVPLVAGGVLVALYFILGKNKKAFLIIGAIAIVLGLVAIGLYVYKNNKVKKYNEGVALYLNDNNIEALTRFEEKDNEALFNDCKNRAVIEFALLDDFDSAKALATDSSVVTPYITNYQNANNGYDRYNALIALVNEFHQQTNYRYNELEELVTKEIKYYIQDLINDSKVGDSFKFGSYNFKVIETIGNTIYAIPDECLFSASIDSTWKEKAIAYFNHYEQEVIDDLMLLGREEYRGYKNYISISDNSWWLEDLSSVTIEDSYGDKHKLRYYVVGKDSEYDRDTVIIQDEQIAGEQSYSYADNEFIWVRPVISFSIED